jgi:hypothetical protein
VTLAEVPGATGPVRAAVVEQATGASTTLTVMVERPPGGAPAGCVGDERFTLASLFGVQRERLAAALAGAAARTAREAGRSALGGMRPALDALLASEVALPVEVAALVGWERADAIAVALERQAPLAPLVAGTAALRARGARFPVRWLSARIGRALEERLEVLPEGLPDALALLDLAAAADVPLDLARAQTLALGWWRARPAGDAAPPSFGVLGERLGLAPEGT